MMEVKKQVEVDLQLTIYRPHHLHDHRFRKPPEQIAFMFKWRLKTYTAMNWHDHWAWQDPKNPIHKADVQHPIFTMFPNTGSLIVIVENN